MRFRYSVVWYVVDGEGEVDVRSGNALKRAHLLKSHCADGHNLAAATCTPVQSLPTMETVTTENLEILDVVF